MQSELNDVAIVGGGPAGLSAALVLGRSRRRVVVIDAGTPRNAPAEHMQGFLSRDGMPPAELLSVARAEVESYSVTILTDEVVDVAAGFTLRLAGGQAVQARHVLLTTGAVDELPDVAAARERWGRDLLHCPYCHGWEVRDQPLGVLGTGAGSVEYAHLIRQWTDDLVFFTHALSVTATERAALEARGIDVVHGTVARLAIESDRLRAVELSDGRTVERAALFFRPALGPNPLNVGAVLGCDLHADWLLQVDQNGRTSVPRVWAAGNAANARAQVITAAGEGSAVAIAINTELVSNDIDVATGQGGPHA
jgi:thioredoxin reductase